MQFDKDKKTFYSGDMDSKISLKSSYPPYVDTYWVMLSDTCS